MERNRYLQLAFNSTIEDFEEVIPYIPPHEQIIIEAGTPLLKRYGIEVVSFFKELWKGKVLADLKIVDGAVAEVEMAKEAGADFVTCVGTASLETLKLFVETCRRLKIGSVIDPINTPNPLKILWKAQVLPDIVLIHRGRDEEASFGKIIQYKNIAKIKGKYEVKVGAAGGIDEKELARALFNGADVVVVNVVRPSDPWKGIVIDENFENKVQEYLTAFLGKGKDF